MTGCRRGKQIVKMEEVIDSVITERTGSIEEWMHQQESFRTFQASFNLNYSTGKGSTLSSPCHN